MPFYGYWPDYGSYGNYPAYGYSPYYGGYDYPAYGYYDYSGTPGYTTGVLPVVSAASTAPPATDNTAHLTMLETPEAFNAALLEFLATI